MEADDIVARMRDYHAQVIATPPYYRELMLVAADKIERLRRDYSCICNEMRRMMEERDEAADEIERLRRQLDQFVGEFKDDVQREAL